MDTFQAMFWDTKVYLNKKHQYLNNEILVHYLNLDSDDLEQIYDDLRYAINRISLTSALSKREAAQDYGEWVQSIQKTLNRIDAIYLLLPPYSDCKDERKDYGEQLYKCLNRHSDLFENGLDERETLWYPDNNEYGYLSYDEKGREIFFITNFDPTPMLEMWENKVNLDDLQEDMTAANDDIRNSVTPYLCLLEDLLRVKFVYAKLLDEFLHIRHAYLDEHELAEQFEKYLLTEKTASKNYKRLGTAEPQAVSNEVFRPENGKPILCGSYTFDRLGAFLYMDFFRGLTNNYIPKKCGNCGKWFLLPFGKYSDYCDNPLPEDLSKTCRDVSARKKYDEKCKTDPVWLAYNRAYKAHYARYMKKKMTNAEFEKWGTYAIELREKTIAGELASEEYERAIKI